MDMNSLKTSYVILREIGRGGMGVVFQAWDRRLERNVALKILSLDEAGDASGAPSTGPAAEMFLQEAKAIARLNHPNIVTLYDIGGSKGRYYLVMEYVEGYNLEMMQKQHKFAKVPADMVIDIGIQICAALECAHRQGIVHRDVKPANVLLNGEGAIKLMDFGIARIQKSGEQSGAGGSLLGSMLYMAPEQLIDADSVDARADLYALGVTLYELLCGVRPFQDQNIAELIRRIMREPVPAIAETGVRVDPRLEALLVKALNKQPSARFQTAAEMGQALSALKASPLLLTTPVTEPSLMPPRAELYDFVRLLLEAA